MSLSNDLIQQFVKANKDETDKKTESTSYGTIVISEGKTYVQLDGSTIYTPVSSTIVVKNGDRVMVTNKDRSLIVTGNLTDPSAAKGDLDGLGENINTRIDEFDIILADKVNTDQLNAVNANIQNLQATNVTISGKLEAAEGKINNLETDNLKVNDTLEAHAGKFDTIDATFVNISGELNANKAKFDELEATDADFRNLEADYGDFKNLTADKLEATDAVIKNLNAEYADINFANIGELAAKKIFADYGVIKEIVSETGHVTKHLVAVVIDGDLINANTLKADRLLVKGENGLYYRLNVSENGDATVTERYKPEELQNGILGEVIVANSVTADKIRVSDLTAFGATLAGFEVRDIEDAEGNVITSAIYSHGKGGVDSNNTGVYMDRDGQMAIGGADSYIKYYKDENGNWKLSIAAEEIMFSSGQSVQDAIADASNVQIGGRNYIRNSRNLVYKNYRFITPGKDASITAALGDGELGFMILGRG